MPSSLITVPNPAVMDEAISRYGNEYQIDRFIEEATELIKILLKNRRTDLPKDRADPSQITQDIQEEIGDVLITLAQVIKIHGNEDLIQKSMEYKTERLRKTMLEKK